MTEERAAVPGGLNAPEAAVSGIDEGGNIPGDSADASIAAMSTKDRVRGAFEATARATT